MQRQISRILKNEKNFCFKAQADRLHSELMKLNLQRIPESGEGQTFASTQTEQVPEDDQVNFQKDIFLKLALNSSN